MSKMKNKKKKKKLDNKITTHLIIQKLLQLLFYFFKRNKIYINFFNLTSNVLYIFSVINEKIQPFVIFFSDKM